jgi:hypothetical protein
VFLQAKIWKVGSISAGLFSCILITIQSVYTARQHRHRYAYPEIDVHAADGLDVLLTEVKVGDSQVLNQTFLAVALRHDSNTTLGSPSEKNLGRGCRSTRRVENRY